MRYVELVTETENKPKEKRFKIINTRHRDGRTYESEGTLPELIKYYSYTLETGASWQDEKGNKKIDRAPKTIKSLIKNLNNAVNNAAANGYAGQEYKYTDLKT